MLMMRYVGCNCRTGAAGDLIIGSLAAIVPAESVQAQTPCDAVKVNAAQSKVTIKPIDGVTVKESD